MSTEDNGGNEDPIFLAHTFVFFVTASAQFRCVPASDLSTETSEDQSFLLLWDRLHRTQRLNVPQEKIVVGVPDYRDASGLNLVSLLLMPFRRQRLRTPGEASERTS